MAFFRGGRGAKGDHRPGIVAPRGCPKAVAKGGSSSHLAGQLLRGKESRDAELPVVHCRAVTPGRLCRAARSEGSRAGKGCGSNCRFRWIQSHYKKKL